MFKEKLRKEDVSGKCTTTLQTYINRQKEYEKIYLSNALTSD